MNCENCELFFWCGGKDICPYEYKEAELMTIEVLSEVTGVSIIVIEKLVEDGYFYDPFDDVKYYKHGYFEEYAITMLNNYSEIVDE